MKRFRYVYRKDRPPRFYKDGRRYCPTLNIRSLIHASKKALSQVTGALDLVSAKLVELQEKAPHD